MSKKPKRSSPATLPAAKLKLLAEHMVEQMNSGTLALPDLSSFEFTWYDLDQYRIQWHEQPRVCRRLFGLSHAASLCSSSIA